MKLRAAGLIAATLSMLLMLLSGAFAQEPVGWRGAIVPYYWLVGIEGTFTVDGEEIEFNKSAGDLFDYVGSAAGLGADLQHDRWVMRAQFYGFSLDTDNVGVEDRPEAGRLQSDFFLSEVAAGYQLSGWREGQTFDLLVGLRLLRASNTLVEHDVGSFSKDRTLVDPLVGIRSSLPILPSKMSGLRFVSYTAIGAGGDSKLVYEFSPGFQYRINDRLAVRAGYRRVGWRVDNHENDGELKFSLAGLTFGVEIGL